MKAINEIELCKLPIKSQGHRNALDLYRRALMGDIDKDIFDDKILEVLEKYSVYPNLDDTRRYLRGIGFSQSRKQYSKLLEAVEKFQDSNHQSFQWNKGYQSAKSEMMKEFSRFKLEILNYYDDDSVMASLPRKDTSAGFSKLITGKSKKGDYEEGIFENYRTEERKARECGSFNKPILPWYRTQGSGAFENGVKTNTCKHKTRFISMVDIYVILAELRFAKPFQNEYKYYNRYAGGKSKVEISNRIRSMQSKYNHYISLDYSSFDQSISDWLIRDAFDVIKAAFTQSSFDDELYSIIVEDFISKNFVMGDGVYYSCKGVPSGSMFTQIIDSIVNELMIRTYMKSVHCKYFDMMIMGDDNIIYFEGDGIDVKSIKTYLSRNFGIHVNHDKSSEGTYMDNPEFLSTIWTSLGADRDTNEVIAKMLYPEHFRDYNVEGNSPELVIYSYIQAYPVAMERIIDVPRFLNDLSFIPRVFDETNIHYETGWLRYQRQYIMV